MNGGYHGKPPIKYEQRFEDANHLYEVDDQDNSNLVLGFSSLAFTLIATTVIVIVFVLVLVLVVIFLRRRQKQTEMGHVNISGQDDLLEQSSASTIDPLLHFSAVLTSIEKEYSGAKTNQTHEQLSDPA
jgi:hypothetical protein